LRKTIYQLLILSSIGFVCYYLYKNDLFTIPKIYNYGYLIFSCILLYVANFFQAINWRLILKLNKISVSTKDSFISIGLSILAKYVPGKIWLIIGRSEYISQKYEVSGVKTSIISLHLQILVIWSGLLLGITGIILSPDLQNFEYLNTAMIALGILSLFAFTPYFYKFIDLAASKLLKKETKFSSISILNIIKLLPVLITYWLLFTVSLYFFGNSISSITGYFSFQGALSYPVAGAIGTLAIFLPGGLGLREAIITAYLTLLGYSLDYSITLSISSRIWFVSIEFLYFLSAFITDRFKPSPSLGISL